MKHNSYDDTNVPEQIIRLTRFYNKLLGYAVTLGLRAGDFAAIVADARWLIYFLGSQQPARKAWSKAATDGAREAQTGTRDEGVVSSSALKYMHLRRVALSLLAILVSIGFAACSQVDRAVDTVQDGINKLNDQAGKANVTARDIADVLKGVQEKLDNETYKNQVEELIRSSGGAMQIGGQGVVDFTRTRVKEDLSNLILTIRGKPLPPRVPVLANTDSVKVDYTNAGRSTVTIVGWNLDVAAALPEKYKITVLNPSTGSRPILREHIGFQGQYAVSLNVSPNGGVALHDYDAKIVFEGFDPLFEILIVKSTPASPVPDTNERIYELQISTQNIKDAGTDSDVFIRLHGEYGDSPEVLLDAPNHDDHEQNDDEVYPHRLKGVGQINSISVRRGPDHGDGPGWAAGRARVKDTKTGFVWEAQFNMWFEGTTLQAERPAKKVN